MRASRIDCASWMMTFESLASHERHRTHSFTNAVGVRAPPGTATGADRLCLYTARASRPSPPTAPESAFYSVAPDQNAIQLRRKRGQKKQQQEGASQPRKLEAVQPGQGVRAIQYCVRAI